MKKQILLLSALFISLTVFGQKSEVKSAEKAIKSNNYAAALQALNKAEPMLANADQKTKAKYYYFKAMAVYKNGTSTNYEEIGKAFHDLLEYEKNTKEKYSADISEISSKLVQRIAKDAQDNYQKAIQTKEPTDYNKAADGFYQVYLLSPIDTSFLDNAALLYYFGKDYDKSITSYEKLLDLNYTGAGTIYIATNKETGEDVIYNDKKSMDLQVKVGLVENPRTELKESKRNTIYKNYAQNFVQKEDFDRAREIITEGRKEFPSDYALLIDEANVYYKKGDEDTFKVKLEEAIQLNPEEPMLYYNVGVMNMNQGNTDEAINYFKKAIELKADYADAWNNIGAAIIETAQPIIDEMNNSLSDFDKYDRLQVKQLEIYKKAVPYYEKAYELDSNNVSVIQTLMGLYQNLSEDAKYKELKAKYDQM
ncbi:MAG TPA: tetratricopeptide repeat protein [Flavobacteriaceae bacterium]|nr:tetratricopeptide repeat protein [Flavobacteriaceae bacterium]